MYNLIRKELNRFFKKKKNIFIIILIILFLFTIFKDLKSDNSTLPESLAFNSDIEAREVENKWNNLVTMKEVEQGLGDVLILDEEEVEYIDEYRKQSVVLKYLYRDIRDDMKKEDMIEIMRRENLKYKNLLFGSAKGFITEEELEEKNYTRNELLANIGLNEYLIEENIEKEFDSNRLNARNFIRRLFIGNNPFILIGLIISLVIDNIVDELEDGSYKLYYTQPYKRSSIYMSKLISSILIALSIILIIVLIFFIIIVIRFGFGDFNYPIAVVESSNMWSFKSAMKMDNIQIISNLKYIIIVSIYLLLIIISLISLIMMMSIILRNLSDIISIFIGLTMFTYMVDIISLKSSRFRYFYPLSYISIADVLEGRVNSSFLYGIILNLSILIISIIYGRYRFINKDLEGGS